MGTVRARTANEEPARFRWPDESAAMASILMFRLDEEKVHWSLDDGETWETVTDSKGKFRAMVAEHDDYEQLVSALESLRSE